MSLSFQKLSRRFQMQRGASNRSQILRNCDDVLFSTEQITNRPGKLCRKCSARFVGSRNRSQSKSLKRLERVKGIEPSYSAWKAAALPLSYTRVLSDLTRRAGRLNCPQPRPKNHLFQWIRPESGLNAGRFGRYIEGPINQRKEVIQCLVPSAVTSLGSPAEHSPRPDIGKA
jgi:hypothetical protein